MPRVKEAINHWTGVKRLSPEEAEKFEDDLRVMSVYPKLKTFQAACHQARIRVPLYHLLNGRPELSKDFLLETFGRKFCEVNDLIPIDKNAVGKGKLSEGNVCNVDDQVDPVRKAHDLKSNLTINDQLNKADWITIISRTFYEQAAILIVCIVVAIYMGYFPSFQYHE
jgi:hypothetical protein